MVTEVRRGLRKKWIQDKLLRVRTLKDMEREGFNDRTIIITNVTPNISVQEVVNAFHNFGAITSVELPSIDSKVKA
jgi:hypothetical protein